MHYFIIGTAGHIDHGKTALIRALTGQDTDRLPEEKRRGITTDLGFASFDLGDGIKAGIIDVPGHEKFIHNMTAGAAGMELVLLVIGADEGIMPQTREHMDILRLLGVKNFIAVLNKCDLTDAEWQDLVEEEVREELGRNGLTDVPIVKVSAKTLQGISELKGQIRKYALGAECSAEPDQKEKDFPRLPVDRVFTVQGFGTVATGTMMGGTITKGQELEIFPTGLRCRVRGIQIYGQEAEVCRAGQRAAVNLSGIEKADIYRGCVLALPESLKTAQILHVRLKILAGSGRIVKNQSRLHFYSGTSQMTCRAVLLDKEELKPGQSGFARLRLDSEAAFRTGDRFVVRFYSPVETIGGGTILEICDNKEKKSRREIIERLCKKENADPETLTELAVQESSSVIPEAGELCIETGMSEEKIKAVFEELEKKKKGYVFERNGKKYFLHRNTGKYLQSDLLREICAYLKKYPYRPGMPDTQLQACTAGKAEKAVADMYIEWLLSKNVLDCIDFRKEDTERKLSWRLCSRLLFPAGYRPEEDEAYRTVERELLFRLQETGYHFCRLSRIEFERVRSEKADEIIRLLEFQGKLIYLAEDIFTLPVLAEQAVKKIKEIMEKEGKITIVQVCGLLDTTRKNARILLEYTDRMEITRKDKAESERVKG